MRFLNLPFSNIRSPCPPSTSHNVQLPYFPLLKKHGPPPLRGVRMDSAATAVHHPLCISSGGPQKDNILVIMGATGCGKSRLSIDLATRFFPQSEIINSDKMQVYSGLDITTNKIPLHDRLQVPHHLLGDVDPKLPEFTPSDFRRAAGLSISGVLSRRNLPIVVGGSNSFIHALVVDRFDPEENVFSAGPSVPTCRFRYECCFLWVDVAFDLLCDYLCERVDEMLESGMLEELAEFFGSGESETRPGLRKAIGVPELERYLKQYGGGGRGGGWDRVRAGVYEGAVREIKENTIELARRQMGKIERLRGAGWDLHRVDATAAFREMIMTKATTSSNNNNSYYSNENENTDNKCAKNKKKRRRRKKKRRWMDVWEREVVKPSVKIVRRFLEEE